jgi:hypothetical protein
MMYYDISHTDLPDLKNRTKTVRVVSSRHLNGDDDGHEEQPMDICIESYRAFYADDMEQRCGLTDTIGDPALKFPCVLGFATLMNPLYGGKSTLAISICSS